MLQKGRQHRLKSHNASLKRTSFCMSSLKRVQSLFSVASDTMSDAAAAVSRGTGSCASVTLSFALAAAATGQAEKDRLTRPWLPFGPNKTIECISTAWRTG